MCLYIKEGQEPIRLTESMTVYKVGSVYGKMFKSPHRGYIYTASIIPPKVELKVRSCVAYDHVNSYTGAIEEGYHAFVAPELNTLGELLVEMVKGRSIKPKKGVFVIPAGSLVYVSPHGDCIVAEQMLFTGRVLHAKS